MIRSELAKQVSAALKSDKRTKNVSIEVIDENGLITLKGQVPSAEIHEAAEAIANAQQGVLEVANALVIETDPEEALIIPPPAVATNKKHPPY